MNDAGAKYLLIGGFAMVLAMEWNNPETLGPMSLGDKLLNATFHSVTPRTAGFNTLDIGALALECARSGQIEARGFTRRDTMLTAAEEYLRRYADRSGRLIANFDIVYLTAWVPGPGQPQPLKPGTAAHRLAEALRTEEHDLGDGDPPDRA